MLGNLTVVFSFDGRDVFGNPEVVTSARCWRNGAEISGTTTITSGVNGEFVSDDIDLAQGTHSGFELALVDDEGTTGLRSSFTVQVADEGPTAPLIGSVTFVPKTVPPSP